MGSIQHHTPVVLIVAAFSRHHDALDWATATMEKEWGATAFVSERFDFHQTSFYEASMGKSLLKTLLAFETLINPAELSAIKRCSNGMEEEYQQLTTYDEERVLNLDPGYVTEAKLVLATTKDRDHRIYLRDGIYAEGTLFYHKGRWRTRPWTYPDFQTPEYHAFFQQCRDYLREQRKATKR